jgi:dual specificity tyrosine-phosphorylation-regulated kinase 2/3/4
MSKFVVFSLLIFSSFKFIIKRLIKKNRFQGFSLQLVRKFAHSILQCLDALYRNKIIHCGKKTKTEFYLKKI